MYQLCINPDIPKLEEYAEGIGDYDRINERWYMNIIPEIYSLQIHQPLLLGERFSKLEPVIFPPFRFKRLTRKATLVGRPAGIPSNVLIVNESLDMVLQRYALDEVFRSPIEVWDKIHDTIFPYFMYAFKNNRSNLIDIEKSIFYIQKPSQGVNEIFTNYEAIKLSSIDEAKAMPGLLSGKLAFVSEMTIDLLYFNTPTYWDSRFYVSTRLAAEMEEILANDALLVPLNKFETGFFELYGRSNFFF